MERKYKITFPEPCHEDWNKMTAYETGRFCNSCSKSVIYFTQMVPEEIQHYFVSNQTKNVCGRFRNEQVNKFDIQIPQSVLRKKRSFQKSFLLALFIVMGTTLFSCKNHSDATLGEVNVTEDTLGIILPAEDSVECSETMIVGKIDIEKYDSLVKAGVKMPPLPPRPPKIEQVKFVKLPNKKTKNKTNNDSVVEHIITMGNFAVEVSIDSSRTK